MNTTTIQVRAKAFSGRGIETVKAEVDDAGIVRVYDCVAGHFTVCHNLSPRAEARIRRIARQG